MIDQQTNSVKPLAFSLGLSLLLLVSACAPPVVSTPPGLPGPQTPLPLPVPGLPSPPSSGDSGDSKEQSGGSNGELPPNAPKKSGGGGGLPWESDGENQSGEKDGDGDSTPNGWESDEAGDGDGGFGEDGDVSFEDPVDSDTDVESPDFGEGEGLSQEELEELEKELEETLGDFDNELEREQEYAERRANDQEDEADGDFDSEEGFEEYDPSKDYGRANRDSNDAGESETFDQGNAQSSTRSGSSSGSKSGKQTNNNRGDEQQSNDANDAIEEQGPADDGRNDDKVARQLRELAEATDDPELKKKYWEEYNRYKRGQ